MAVARLLAALFRGRLWQSAALGTLAALAVAISVATPVYVAGANRYARLSALAAAAPDERVVTISGSFPVRADTMPQVRAKVGAALPPERYSTVGTLAATGRVTGPATGPLGGVAATVAARDGVCAHLALTGRCPQSPGEVALGAAVAERLGVAPGGRIGFTAGTAGSRPLTVTALYRVADPEDAYWVGRYSLVLDPHRIDAALLAAPATLFAAEPAVTRVAFDLTLREEAVRDGDLAELASGAAGLRELSLPDLTATSRLAALVDRIAAGERILNRGALLAAGQLLLVCLVVVLLAVGYAAAGRRPESAIALLRGAPAGHRALIAFGPALLTVLAAAPVGVLAGYALARAVIRAAFGAGGSAPVTAAMAITPAVACLVLVAAAVVPHRPPGSLAEALRRTPPRRRFRPYDLLTVAVLALTAGAVYQLRVAPAGLAAFAPMLLALSGGLLAARLVPPAAAAAARSAVRRGRAGPALAAAQLARQPGAHRLLTLFTVLVAVALQAVAGWDVARGAIADRAAWELGADRVLPVRAASPAALRAAVRAADPSARWAMAAQRAELGSSTMLAVQSDRFGAVVAAPPGAPADLPRRIGAALRPPAGEPLIVDGGALVLRLTVTDPGAAPPVTAHLTDPAGDPVEARFPVPAAVGPQAVTARLAGCADGCRFAWFGFSSSPDGLRLTGLSQRGPDRTLLDGAALAAPGRWRAGFSTQPGEVTIRHGAADVGLAYVPKDVRLAAAEVRLRHSDVPFPLPVVASDSPDLVQNGHLRSLPLFGSGDRPVEVRLAGAAEPGLAQLGYLVDHEYAERSGEEPLTGRQEVWLARGAPATVLAGLRAAGLAIASGQSQAGRRAALGRQAPGLAGRLYLVAALLALALAAGGAAVVAAVDLPDQAADLAALRRQGLPVAAVRRAGFGGQAALVGAALVAGVAAGWPSWLAARELLPVFADRWTVTGSGAPGWPVPAALVAVAAVLAAVAALAARRLTARVTAATADPTATPRRGAP